MGSQLDDALRAAVAAAQHNHPSEAPVASVSTSTPPSKRKAKRKRRRSRSESLVSDDDPIKRIEAFKERMFDDTTTTRAFTTNETSAEDVVQVQWKPKKPMTTSLAEKEDDIPQVIRAKVMAPPSTVQSMDTNVNKTTKKKNNRNKKKMTPRVVEIQVPMVPPPPVSTTPKTTVAVKQRDDDALVFSDPSDHEEIDATASAKALVAARVAARKATQSTQEKPMDAKCPVMTQPASEELKPNGSVIKPTNGTGTMPTNDQGNTGSLATSPKPSVQKSPLAKPTVPTTTDDAAEEEDRWDLNALVKKTIKKATSSLKPSMSEDDDADSDGESEFDGQRFRDHQMHLFSQLIDEAARERWELVEVGRLVRIFAAQWSHKKKKTARFLRRCCPELVSVDFLEGLNIPLTSQQLLKIFERGSGTPVIIMNKIASAVENGNMHVQDEVLQSFIMDQIQSMATHREIIEFLLPLLESLSKVKDVGVLLKVICEHWHIDRTVALVQDILLTPIFDDLDGQSDEILEDLPALEGRLDFPSRMDDEDADENGNLKGLIAGEDSDLGESDPDPEDIAEEELGEVLSDDAEGDDSHGEDETYEGETDSEEEREAQERLNPTKRRRSRFILDEADEDDDVEDEDDLVVDDDDEEDDPNDSGDSSDDDDSAQPQRKRLRRGE